MLDTDFVSIIVKFCLRKKNCDMFLNQIVREAVFDDVLRTQQGDLKYVY